MRWSCEERSCENGRVKNCRSRRECERYRIGLVVWEESCGIGCGESRMGTKSYADGRMRVVV